MTSTQNQNKTVDILKSQAHNRSLQFTDISIESAEPISQCWFKVISDVTVHLGQLLCFCTTNPELPIKFINHSLICFYDPFHPILFLCWSVIVSRLSPSVADRCTPSLMMRHVDLFWSPDWWDNQFHPFLPVQSSSGFTFKKKKIISLFCVLQVLKVLESSIDTALSFDNTALCWC